MYIYTFTLELTELVDHTINTRHRNIEIDALYFNRAVQEIDVMICELMEIDLMLKAEVISMVRKKKD